MLKRIVGGVALFLIGLVSSWVHEACFEEGRPVPRPAALPRSTDAAAALPGMVLVDFEDGTAAARIDELERSTGVDLAFATIEGVDSGVTIGSLGEPEDDAAQLVALRALPGVTSVEPLYLYEAAFAPNDPDRKLQWHLDQIGMTKAWDLADGRDVIVAVLDTGIAYADAGRVAKVPDLGETKIVPGWNFPGRNAEPLDGNGHGTHVAGTIAQSTNNGVGVSGVAFRAALMPVKVLTDAGSGTSADIADGIRWAVDHGAQVLNLSLGGGGYSEAMAKAVVYARAKGAVVVCAAGNGGRGQVEYPAAYPGAVAVSAVRYDTLLAPYSSWGAELDLAAPGGDKSVDQNGDGFPDGVLQNTIVRGDPTKSEYAWYQGTSMATPHVAGVAALLFSTGLTSPDEVEHALFSTAKDLGDKGWDQKYGHGLVDAAAALGATPGKGPTKRHFGRLVLAALLLLLAVILLPKRGARLTLATFAGLFIGAAGLFFLPWLLGRLPFGAALAQPIPMMFGALTGGGPASPLWYSALLPFGLSFLLFQWRTGRDFAGGLALGIGGFLGYAAYAGDVQLAWLPGPLQLAWLVVNAFLCFVIGRALLRKESAP